MRFKYTSEEYEAVNFKNCIVSSEVVSILSCTGMTSHSKITKSAASSLLKQIFLLGTLLTLGACGSTQPSEQAPASNAPTSNKSAQKNVRQIESAIDPQVIAIMNQISNSLAKKNLQSGIWEQDISDYRSQKQVRATSKYVDLSDRVHTVSTENKCSSRQLRIVKQAMSYHPSSLPMLSVLLECANQYDLVNAQTSIADSIVLISNYLLENGQNGLTASTPIQVREVYEAEYLLDLAGIELFDTEMIVEKDRILILHHGLDSLTKDYSVTYADQTEFFISSIKATLSDSELSYFDDVSSIIDIKKQALLSSQHYAVQLDSYRNMLFEKQYEALIETINSRQHDTPIALAFLAQAHLALGTFDTQTSIQDDLVYYAELGIPDLQSVAGQVLLRMDAKNNVAIVAQAFRRTAEKIGLENASFLWVRTLLADAEFTLYLDVLASQLDQNALKAWETSLTNIASTHPQLTSSMRKRIKDFYNVLQAQQAGDIAMQGTMNK